MMLVALPLGFSYTGLWLCKLKNWEHHTCEASADYKHMHKKSHTSEVYYDYFPYVKLTIIDVEKIFKGWFWSFCKWK